MPSTQKERKLGWFRKAALKYAMEGLRKLPMGAMRKELAGADFLHFFGAGTQDSIWEPSTPITQERMYRTREIVYACIRQIVYAFPDAELEIGTESTDGEFDKEDNNDVLDVLKNPNPELDYTTFNWYHLAHWLTTGRSMLWKWRTRSTDLAELWPMPSSWVRVIGVQAPSQDKRLIDHYELQIPNAGGMVDIEPEDMIYMRFPDPNNMIGAVGPLEAAARSLQIDDGREQYLVEMLENVVFPGLILRQTSDFSQSQADDIRAVLKDRIGKGKRGSPLLLSGEGAGAELPTPLSDMDWPGVSNLSETRICAVLGVPATLVGLRSGLQTTGLSGQDVASAEGIFYRGTMRALWNANASAYTMHLLKNGKGEDTNKKFRYNTNNVKAMQPDLQLMSSSVSAISGTGLIYVNEARKMLGLPVDPKREGKVLMPMGVTEVTIGEEQNPPTPPTGEAGAGHETPPSKPKTPPPTEGAGEETEVPEGGVATGQNGQGKALQVSKGGPGSGNFGHAGRPGEVGGSSSSGGTDSDSESDASRGRGKPAKQDAETTDTMEDWRGNKVTLNKPAKFGHDVLAILGMGDKAQPEIFTDAQHITETNLALKECGEHLLSMRDHIPAFKKLPPLNKLQMTLMPPEARGRFGVYQYGSRHSAVQISATPSAKAPVIGKGNWNVCDDITRAGGRGAVSSAATFRHELGHHVWGVSGPELAPKVASPGIRAEFVAAYKSVGKTGMCSQVSGYSGRNVREGFAESFAAYTHPGYKNGLPSPIHEFFLRHFPKKGR